MTNRRYGISLARLLRAGEFTAVWVPDEGHEAMRTLVRPRTGAVETLRTRRQQVNAFMLKQGIIYLDDALPSMVARTALRPSCPSDRAAGDGRSRADRQERVQRLETVIAEFGPHWSLAAVVFALRVLRGVDLIAAVTFATEVRDASRFESPVQSG